jgi:hypothetical protein
LRELAQSHGWIGEDDVFGSPRMEDDEMSAAEPATEMGDRRQRALRDRVVRRPDALGPETEALGDPREGQKVRAVAVECRLAREARIIERAAVIGRDGRQRRQAAVVAAALADEGEFSRRD